MHSLVYVLLLVSSGLAHYRGGFDARNLIERDEPERDVDGLEIVRCPVCETSAWSASNEECPIIRNGKTYKKCLYGSYNNPKCGNMKDCYRGPGDPCTDKMTFDYYGQKCAPGFYCDPSVMECTGHNYAVDSNRLSFIRQRHHEKNPSLKFNDDPIRYRRQASM